MPSSQQAEHDTSIWSYIPITNFSAPEEPTSEAVLGGIRDIWAQIWPWHSNSQPDPEMALPQLRTAPTDLLDRLVPAPNWQAQTQQALSETLRTWRRTANENAGNQIVVGAPFCQATDTISGWASEHDYQTVAPPTIQQILNQDTTWLHQWTNVASKRLVLPNLERTFLRHYQGLHLVRGIFEALTDPAYSCLIGCQSWAWEYLQQSCPISLARTQVWTLAPLTSERLVTWIHRELTDTQVSSRVTFRRTDNGKLAIDLRRESVNESDSLTYYASLFDQITARSRGNPAIAWSLWRRSLSVATDENVNKEAQAEARQDDKITIWVRPWDTLDLPTVPNGISSEGLHILHALLLHDGLPEDLIFALMPGHKPALARLLSHLAQLGLISVTQDRLWRINEIAYPSIRQRLRHDGYFVDSL